MKKTIFIFIIITSFVKINAQKHDRLSKIDRAKVGVYTKELELTTEQAEKFWPIYFKYQKQIYKLRGLQSGIRKREDILSITNEEANKLYQKLIHCDEKILEKKITMLRELEKIIDYRQLVLMSVAEKKFRKDLIMTIRNSNKK